MRSVRLGKMRLLRMLRTSGMLRGSRRSVRGHLGLTSSQAVPSWLHALLGSHSPSFSLQGG